VKVSAVIGARNIVACHCGQCRRWTGGGPYFSTDVTDVQIDGEAHVAIFAASAWGERGFCRNCGTTLFWKVKDGPVTNLAAGLFDDQAGLKVTEEIFVDCRAHWHSGWSDAAQSTEAEEIAKFEASRAAKAN